MITTTCPLCFYNLERAQKAHGRILRGRSGPFPCCISRNYWVCLLVCRWRNWICLKTLAILDPILKAKGILEEESVSAGS